MVACRLPFVTIWSLQAATRQLGAQHLRCSAPWQSPAKILSAHRVPQQAVVLVTPMVLILTVLIATVMRVTEIQAGPEQKRQDRSARNAEKHDRRAMTPLVAQSAQFQRLRATHAGEKQFGVKNTCSASSLRRSSRRTERHFGNVGVSSWRRSGWAEHGNAEQIKVEFLA